MRHFAVLAFAAVALSACGSVDHALQGPGLSPMGYPAALVPQQQAVFVPQQGAASSNSLWRAGARAFFNDQRAKNVGDIVTVVVDIDDRAQTSNTTARSRSNSYEARTPTILGIESSLGKFLPGQYDPANAFATGGESKFNGAGSQQRSEKISITIAAIVTGVLPNGNIVVQGSQEVRTGREVRVLTVSGIARTEDVSAANTIRHTQLAEARISYGGTGDVTRSNTPPAAQTLVEKFSPF